MGGLRATPGGRALEEQERLTDPRDEMRRVYGDPDEEAQRLTRAEQSVVAVMRPRGSVRIGAHSPTLTAGELDAIASTLFEALQMGRRFTWSGKQRERVRSALGKLNGANYR